VIYSRLVSAIEERPERFTNRVIIGITLALVPIVVAALIYIFLIAAGHHAACDPLIDHPPRGEHRADCD
jgi:hypothetical protein